MTEAGFLASIEAAPCDDAPPLIYADWLDEHGREDEAAKLRQAVKCRKCDQHSVWIVVNSPSIDKIRFDHDGIDHGTITVLFRNGVSFDFPNRHTGDWTDFLNSSSKTRFLHFSIREWHGTRQIQPTMRERVVA